MISMIKELFKSYDYVDHIVDNVLLFATDESSAKTVFWLVIQENDLESLLDRQAELFDACKNINQNSALDKNISMLVLWETNGNLDLGDMKRKVISVEEDPYFFKKHVLYFSGQECDSLGREMGKKSLRDFLQAQIASQKIFEMYKSNPLSQEWRSLLYRIAIKIPFVDINIDFSGGLTSLIEKNEERVRAAKDTQLTDFDHGFFKIFNARTSNEINNEDVPPEKYLAELLSALKGKGDGD